MKYLIVGSGGTGGCIGAFLANSGKDVTFIARGAHLEAMEQRGLSILSPTKGKLHIKSDSAKFMRTNDYDDKADVIFVCVKCYSIDEVMPFIAKAAHKDSIVIPITNVFGIATQIAEKIPEVVSLGGCIYIASDISKPGEIIQRGPIFKMIYGFREKDERRKNQHKYMNVIEKLTLDLIESGIDASVSDNISADVYKKYSFVSPMSATGVYFNANAGDMQAEGEPRQTFIALMKEVIEVGRAMDIDISDNLIEENLKILSELLPNMTSSMQKDFEKGGKTEADGLIFDVVRDAKTYGVDVPMYKKIAEKLGFKI